MNLARRRRGGNPLVRCRSQALLLMIFVRVYNWVAGRRGRVKLLVVIAQFWSFANDMYSEEAGERCFRSS